MEEIPIIIFHLGNQEYPKLCLQQAIKHENKVILLNDNPINYINLITNKCRIEDYRKYFTNAYNFQKLYKNYSYNAANYEFICIIRWMCAYEYMKAKILKEHLCVIQMY
jgi:hypothetical protein